MRAQDRLQFQFGCFLVYVCRNYSVSAWQASWSNCYHCALDPNSLAMCSPSETTYTPEELVAMILNNSRSYSEDYAGKGFMGCGPAEDVIDKWLGL